MSYFTVSVTRVVRTGVPLMPVIVTVLVPLGVLLVVVTVIVEFTGPLVLVTVTGFGSNVGRAPDGNPLALNSTEPVNPYKGVIVTV